MAFMFSHLTLSLCVCVFAFYLSNLKVNWSISNLIFVFLYLKRKKFQNWFIIHSYIINFVAFHVPQKHHHHYESVNYMGKNIYEFFFMRYSKKKRNDLNFKSFSKPKWLAWLVWKRVQRLHTHTLNTMNQNECCCCLFFQLIDQQQQQQ